MDEKATFMELQGKLAEAQLEVARLQAKKLRLELGETIHIDLLPEMDQ